MSESRQSRQRLSAEERQDEIVKTAIELAGEQGVDNVTTQDIANAVGVTQGAIFRHFPTKDMIWIAAVRWMRERLMRAVDMAVGQGKDPLARLDRIFFAHIGIAEKYPAVPRLLMSTNPHLKRLLQEVITGYEERITALIEEARTQGQVRQDLDAHHAAALYTAMIQGLVTRVLILGARKSLLAEAKKVFPIYLAGIAATGVTAPGGQL